MRKTDLPQEFQNGIRKLWGWRVSQNKLFRFSVQRGPFTLGWHSKTGLYMAVYHFKGLQYIGPPCTSARNALEKLAKYIKSDKKRIVNSLHDVDDALYHLDVYGDVKR